MITTRRQITNEQDRYGGYASRPTSEITREDTEELRPDDFTRYPRRRNTVDTGVDFDTETAYKHEEELRYSERPLKPGLEEYIGLPKVKAPTRASVKSQKKRMPRESEDIMPSIKTRAYMTDRPVEEIEEQTEKKETSVNKTKLVLCAYIAAVIVLAAIVIATGIAISGAENSVSMLERELSIKNAVIVGQEADLAALANDTFLTGAAVESGMEKIDGAQEVDLIELTNPENYEARTNWFDKFCDWLSKIIGG